MLLDITMPEMTGYQFLTAFTMTRTGSDASDNQHSGDRIDLRHPRVPDERALLYRASRIMSKSDLSAGVLIDAIEDALQARFGAGGMSDAEPVILVVD